jgi:hypothetical protein
MFLTCTSCPFLRSDLEASAIEIKNLKHKLDHSSRYTVLSPSCETFLSRVSFSMLPNRTLSLSRRLPMTARLEKTKLSEKMIVDDLSRIEEGATKSTYKMGVRFERCEDKDEKSAPKFIPSSNYHKEEEALKPTKTHYPSNPKSSFNPKREVKRIPQAEKGSFCLHVL